MELLMEGDQGHQGHQRASDMLYYISVPDGLYSSWRHIGAQEGLDTDGDIIQYLVNLYYSSRRKDKEKCSIKCVHCHCPLTLYCNTCQHPSHQATPTQPPPPSLSSPPPALSSQVLPSSSHLPASLDCASKDVSGSCTPVLEFSELKEDTAASMQKVQGGDSDLGCVLDIKKSQSTASGSKQGARSAEADDTFRAELPIEVDQRKSSQRTLTTLTTESVVSSDEGGETTSSTSGTTEPVGSSDHRNGTKIIPPSTTDPLDNLDKGNRMKDTTSSTTEPVNEDSILVRQYKLALEVIRTRELQKRTSTLDQRTTNTGSSTRLKRRKRRLEITEQTTSDTMVTDSDVHGSNTMRRDSPPQDAICRSSIEDTNLPDTNRSSRQDTNLPDTNRSSRQDTNLPDTNRSSRQDTNLPDTNRSSIEDTHLPDTGRLSRQDRNLSDRAEEHHSDQAQKEPSAEQGKRKPMELKDMKEGFIIPAEERPLAQIIVFDESFHKTQDGSSRSRRNYGVPLQECARQLTQTVDVEGCRSDPEASETCPSQGHGASLSRKESNIESGDSEYPSGTESGELEDANRLPFKILVSAEKVPPLRTADGHYMRTLYSYFECAHCNKAFVNKRTFNQHVQTHIDQNIHKCPLCKKGFENVLKLREHEKTRHVKSECSVCGKQYTNKKQFIEHMKLHTENGGVMKCPGCEYQSTDFLKYRKHKYDCAYLRPALQCEMCGVYLKSTKALKHHIAAIHNNDRPFKCQVCDKSFVFETKLTSHMKYRHAEGGKCFHCEKCGKSFHEPKGLSSHQKSVHSDEKPFKCSHCPMAFVRKHTLTVHMRKHTGEKPYQCDVCLQTFAQKNSLTLHLKNHHGAESKMKKKTIQQENCP